MTQEEKQLLLVDLCARLPYGVNVQVKEWTALDTELKIGHIQRLQNDDIELKPYLRPMSSMTEEEREQLYFAIDRYGKIDNYGDIDATHHDFVFPKTCRDYIDWLNENHFDYRGLIPMGLALEAPEGIYD